LKTGVVLSLSEDGRVRRRDFIKGIAGSTVAWPLAAGAQQSAMRVIGFLDSRSSDAMSSRLGAFRQGLKEVGFVEGENLKVEYRWADNQINRVSEMATELVRRQVDVIFATGGPPAALAAKSATATIPIVFLVGEDPTRLGLVSSLTRPTGNLTGVNLLSVELEAKRLELLHQLVPQATRVAVLVNSADAKNTETTLRELEGAAGLMGIHLQILKASTAREISDVVVPIGPEAPNALFVGSSAFLNSRRVQLVQLAAFHRLPATYSLREAAEVGGLMSYGPNILDAYRQGGVYAARILKGVKPADLPVIQQSKFELVINMTTARLLGLAVSPSLLAITDEVIE
jgi:ABC-type uncharacterized transport system substrate-binding protein